MAFRLRYEFCDHVGPSSVVAGGDEFELQLSLACQALPAIPANQLAKEDLQCIQPVFVVEESLCDRTYMPEILINEKGNDCSALVGFVICFYRMKHHKFSYNNTKQNLPLLILYCSQSKAAICFVWKQINLIDLHSKTCCPEKL